MQIAICFCWVAAGWLAAKALSGKGYGCGMDFWRGVSRALWLAAFYRSIGSPEMAEVCFHLMAIGCAAVRTILVAMVNGSAIRARAF